MGLCSTPSKQVRPFSPISFSHKDLLISTCHSSHPSTLIRVTVLAAYDGTRHPIMRPQRSLLRLLWQSHPSSGQHLDHRSATPRCLVESDNPPARGMFGAP